MRRTFPRTLWLVPCAALLLAAGAAGARPPGEAPDNLLNDRFSLQADVIRSSDTTALRYDPNAGAAGTDLAVEPDLGVPRHKLIARGELAFRLHDRHRVRLANYFVPLDRSGTAVLARTISFGNSVYTVGELVQSELNVRVLALSYSYSFLRSDRYELAGSLGFDVIGVEAKATVVARLRTERQDRSAPAPLVGLETSGRLSSRWYAEGRIQYLKVVAGGIHGSFKNFEANALYRLHPNATLGLGYTGFNVDVSSTRVGGADHGSFGLKSLGPQLLLRVGF